MAQAVISVRNKRDETLRIASARARKTITGVYLITNTGLDILIGRDADEMRERIEQDKENSPLAYRFFDDDKRVWSYWATLDVDGKIKPHTFPDPSQYILTSPQLYAKAVTYPHILAHAIGFLKQKPASLWDKLMKPTTIILAIVAIVLIMGICIVAAQG